MAKMYTLHVYKNVLFPKNMHIHMSKYTLCFKLHVKSILNTNVNRLIVKRPRMNKSANSAHTKPVCVSSRLSKRGCISNVQSSDGEQTSLGCQLPRERLIVTCQTQPNPQHTSLPTLPCTLYSSRAHQCWKVRDVAPLSSLYPHVPSLQHLKGPTMCQIYLLLRLHLCVFMRQRKSFFSRALLHSFSLPPSCSWSLSLLLVSLSLSFSLFPILPRSLSLSLSLSLFLSRSLVFSHLLPPPRPSRTTPPPLLLPPVSPLQTSPPLIPPS